MFEQDMGNNKLFSFRCLSFLAAFHPSQDA